MLVLPELYQSRVEPEFDDPFVHHPRHLEVEMYLEQNGITKMPWIAIDDTAAFLLDGDGNSVGGSGNEIFILNNTVLLP